MNNIILTGMPGVGKSTIGVLLAKSLGREFIDTDLAIQKTCNALLQDIIREKGIDAFIEIENSVLQSLLCSNTVIATGGSAVLCPDAMNHLRSGGVIIYLEADINLIAERISNIESRGIVKETSQSLQDIYKIRKPLYERYADIVIQCGNRNHEEILKDIIFEVDKHHYL